MKDNKVYNAILARRSIRGFKDEKVEKEKIDMLLKAAMAAPSACNLQPWSFIVIDDEKILSDVETKSDQGNYNSPLAIVICGEYKHIPWEGDGYIFDCGAAAQNLMLEAYELGLASVCVGGFDEDALRKKLDIPEDTLPLAIIEIGYPTYERVPHTWYTPDAVHYNKYDSKRQRTMRTIEMLNEDIKNKLI